MLADLLYEGKGTAPGLEALVMMESLTAVRTSGDLTRAHCEDTGFWLVSLPAEETRNSPSSS